MVLQALDRGDQPLDDKVGVGSEVPRDMRAYCLDVWDRLRCPNDPGSPEKSALCPGVIEPLPSIQLRQAALGLHQQD